MKKLFVILMLCTVVALSLVPIYATPTLTLVVEQSPLTVFPPMMIYTAKLSSDLVATNAVVDFYNATADPADPFRWFASDPVDPYTGKAQVTQQFYPGNYKAVAKTAINGISIVSNIVYYTVH